MIKQEDKQLLLKELCAILLYGVKIRILGLDSVEDLNSIGKFKNRNELSINGGYYVETIRPYLRLMSSMTEKEKEEWENLDDYCILDDETKRHDFLVSHHFDYRGLIPMGLALVAKEGMYKIE